jgi:hypothetical protein
MRLLIMRIKYNTIIFIVLAATNVYLVLNIIGSELYKHLNINSTTPVLTDGTYQECIISEPNKIAEVLVQDNLNHDLTQKATFYDFSQKPYPATINVDSFVGVVFISKLSSSKTAFLYVDYTNRRCELSITNDAGDTIYDKKGYYGIGLQLNDIDDISYKLAKHKI